jgi:hypothetical protein
LPAALPSCAAILARIKLGIAIAATTIAPPKSTPLLWLASRKAVSSP